jgi:hypothetical protein
MVKLIFLPAFALWNLISRQPVHCKTVFLVSLCLVNLFYRQPWHCKTCFLANLCILPIFCIETPSKMAKSVTFLICIKWFLRSNGQGYHLSGICLCFFFFGEYSSAPWTRASCIIRCQVTIATFKRRICILHDPSVTYRKAAQWHGRAVHIGIDGLSHTCSVKR